MLKSFSTCLDEADNLSHAGLDTTLYIFLCGNNFAVKWMVHAYVYTASELICLIMVTIVVTACMHIFEVMLIYYLLLPVCVFLCQQGAGNIGPDSRSHPSDCECGAICNSRK